jgi:hypothetical protein
MNVPVWVWVIVAAILLVLFLSMVGVRVHA